MTHSRNACEGRNRSQLCTHVLLSVTSPGADRLRLLTQALLFSRSSTAPRRSPCAPGPYWARPAASPQQTSSPRGRQVGPHSIAGVSGPEGRGCIYLPRDSLFLNSAPTWQYPALSLSPAPPPLCFTGRVQTKTGGAYFQPTWSLEGAVLQPQGKAAPCGEWEEPWKVRESNEDLTSPRRRHRGIWACPGPLSTLPAPW